MSILHHCEDVSTFVWINSSARCLKQEYRYF